MGPGRGQRCLLSPLRCIADDRCITDGKAQLRFARRQFLNFKRPKRRSLQQSSKRPGADLGNRRRDDKETSLLPAIIICDDVLAVEFCVLNLDMVMQLYGGRKNAMNKC